MSHSSRDSIETLALKTWLEGAEPGVVGEVFADLDSDTGIPARVRLKEALRRANDRCGTVICLVSKRRDAGHECRGECEPTTGSDISSEWQRCDLFGDGPKTVIEVHGGTKRKSWACSGSAPERCSSCLLCGDRGLRIWPQLRPTDRLGRG